MRGKHAATVSGGEWKWELRINIMFFSGISRVRLYNRSPSTERSRNEAQVTITILVYTEDSFVAEF